MASIFYKNINQKIYTNYKSILPKISDTHGVLRKHQKFSMMKETTAGPIYSLIEEKVKVSLNPCHLEVINESYQHNVPPGSETHFKLVVVSSHFTDLPLIKRHRMINEILCNELQNGIHALSIVAKTPEQWEKSDQVVEKSPACRGGFGK